MTIRKLAAQEAVEETPGGRDGPRSLTRLLALFDALSAAADGMSLAELSAMLGSPKSSLLNLLRPLVSEDYLIHNGGVYRLGPSMFRLASAVRDAWYLPRVMRPFMEQLAIQTGESVLIGVPDFDKGLITFVDIVYSPHPVRFQIGVGLVRRLYPAVAGRLLIAYTDPARRQKYLADVVFDVHTAVPMNKASLKRDIEQIRRDGIAWGIDTYYLGLSAVAAPLFENGECVACLHIAGPSDRFKQNLEELKKQVGQCAAKASLALDAAAAVPADPEPERRRRSLRSV